MASKFNFSLDQGADQTVEITYAPNNVPFDLTGWDIKCQLRRTRSDTTVALELKTTDATAVVGGATVLLPFKGTQTNALSGNYFYDVFAYQGSNRLKIVEGQTSIDAPVTRPVP